MIVDDDRAPETPKMGIVLAAGRGVRMGGPKALLRVGSSTLTQQHGERLVEVGCRLVVVVVRPDSQAALDAIIDQEAPHLKVSMVTVPAKTADQAQSLRAGLSFIEAHHSQWLGQAEALLVVTPVDLLPPKACTFGRLIDAVSSSDHTLDAATPTYAGRGGHPVVVRPRVVRDERLEPLRVWLNALGQRRLRLPVDDPLVLGDLDVVEDVASAERFR